MLRNGLSSQRQAGSVPAVSPAANEIDQLRVRYANYVRAGKRKAALAVHLRMVHLVERQLRREIKSDAVKARSGTKTGRALRRSVKLERIGL